MRSVSKRRVAPLINAQVSIFGRAWRTLTGFADFAIVQPYLSAATSWVLDLYDVLYRVFTTRAWLSPPAQRLLESYVGCSLTSRSKPRY